MSKERFSHIITGQWRGRKILLPQDDAVRPTRNMVLQAGFNMLGSHTHFQNKTLLDLCCGSGQWGLEALSRGAAHVTFVDTDIQTLTQNLAVFDVNEQQATVVQKRLETITNSVENVDIIIADPPYGSDLYDVILSNPQWGKTETLWLIETGHRYDLIIPEHFKLIKNKKYGKSTLWLLQQN
ncbi:MAG: 16S rRNA (guanine(966)-N(2))-methyltransferase RsmD [Alphaproteobacteria bacterium]|nr:16S rRNA (guanine(966)-N(2))-methyltransferase RsmD [Alphaproteobacteria bacterium]MDD9920476.1 16S rRNA (guanine(966)-N(2))-methyltransferase RsmD [Alphaproteobacteria bacterium]